MASVFPRDMTTAHKWARMAMTLNRRQEMSRTPQDTIVKDMGPALWSMEARTMPMAQELAEAYHAELQSLGGALRTFYAHTAQRPQPYSYTSGDMSALTVNAIRSDNAALRVSGLPAGLQLLGGDFLSIETSVGGKELHRLVTGGTVSGTGLSPWVEVVPHLRPSVTVSDAVTMINPLVEMRLEPGSLELSQRSGRIYEVSFSAMQVVR